MEPWDGPALVTFTDGLQVSANPEPKIYNSKP
jgi:glutamate synthase domain-containing protein 1